MKIVCPICMAETTWEENPDRPFCSKRCRLVDLGKWVSGEYKVEEDDPGESGAEGGNADE